MSGRIEAGVRLMTVADQQLAGVRNQVDGFITVLRTETDPAARSAQGKLKLTAALEDANRAAAAVSAAHTGASGASGTASAVTTIDDARTGVLELRDQVQGLLAGGGGGRAEVNPLGLQALVEEQRGAVAVARDVLNRVEGSQEVAESKVFGEIAREAKPVKPAGVTDAHIDAVTTAAAALDTSVGKMPTVEKVAVDMVAAARQGKYDDLVGREQEVDQVLTILSRKRKANPILLGDPGVGKTQLVEGLAVRISRGEVPEAMRDLRIYSIDAATLKAEAGAEQGAMEKLVKSIVEEMAAERARGGKVALFVDELHTLMGAGDTAQQLKPALARGDISLIGATTWDEFNKHIAGDGALVRRVAPISIDELSKDQVLEVLRSVQGGLTKHHRTVIVDPAIKEVQRISTKYARDRKQPDPAIELLDHAMSRVSTSWHGAAPAQFLAMSNDVGTLKTTIKMLDREIGLGDPRTAADLVSSRARLAELEPKLAAMSEQLDAERTVLGTRNDLLTKYLAHKDAGEIEQADALLPRLQEAGEAVKALRVQYPERLLTDIVDEAAVREAASNLYNRTISAGGADEAKKLLGLGDRLRTQVIGQGHVTDQIASAIQRRKSGMADDKPATFLMLGGTGTGKTETVKVVTREMTENDKNMIRVDMGEFSEAHSIAKLFGSPPGYVGYGDQTPLHKVAQNPDAVLLFDEVEKAHPEIWQKMLALFDEGRVTLGDGKVVDARDTMIFMTSNLPDSALSQRFSPEFRGRLDATVRFNDLTRENLTTIVDTLQLPKVKARAAEAGLDMQVSDAAKSRIIDYGYAPSKGARPLKGSLENHVAEAAAQMVLTLKAAGRQVDTATPQPVTLDIDPAGTGFIARADGLEIKVPARPTNGMDLAAQAPAASAPASGSAPAANAAQQMDWSLGDDAAGAMHPPTSQPQPILNGDN